VGQRPHAIRRSDSGFTLTELLIVIVILGVLTGIVVIAVGAFTNRGEVAACRTAMKTTEVGIETYRAQHSGTLPTVITDLVPAYLRTDPTLANASTAYTISINYTTGEVTGVLDAAGVPTTTSCLA
jgi:prepilin-type N-terminal cleavage/methylation domain-containing protein